MSRFFMVQCVESDRSAMSTKFIKSTLVSLSQS